MKYDEFRRRFGGAYRTKNLYDPRTADPAKTCRVIDGLPVALTPYVLPEDCEIEREFIRQEPWEGEYLFHLAAAAKTGICEIGRFNGGSAFLMACANSRVPVFSIDIAPQNDEKLSAFMKQAGIDGNVQLLVGDSRADWGDSVGPFDLLFIDGDHSYEGCLADLENWYPRLETGGDVILHDFYNGNQVMLAVIDFLSRHRVEMITPLFRGREHWRAATGSMCHFRKLD